MSTNSLNNCKRRFNKLVSSLGQQAVSAEQFSSKVIFKKVLIRTSMDLRRNRKHCLKFSKVLETQEYEQALQDAEERRSYMMSSKLWLVRNIYYLSRPPCPNFIGSDKLSHRFSTDDIQTTTSTIQHQQ